jgi:hypothetical protein
LSTSVHLQPLMPAQASWLSARHLNTWAICTQQHQQQMHVSKRASLSVRVTLASFVAACTGCAARILDHWKTSHSHDTDGLSWIVMCDA